MTLQDPNTFLAQALKRLRTGHGWSLDDAAGKTGVSKAMLGQIERSESSPTIATLWKIANGFQIPISSFLNPPGGDRLDGAICEGRDTHKPSLVGDPLILVSVLFPYDARFGFELLELTLLPGVVRSSEPHAKGVTEHVMVISGAMEVLVEGRWTLLSERSAVRFAADRHHGYRNLGPVAAVFHNLIHYPADYEKSVSLPGIPT